MVENFLGTDMSRDEFMERLAKDQNLMWAIDEQLAEKDQRVEQLERTTSNLRNYLDLTRKEHQDLLSSVIVLIREICDHFDIKEKYGLQNCWAVCEDHGGPLLEEAWNIAKLLDWRECPR